MQNTDEVKEASEHAKTEEKFICGLCGKEFTRRWNLQRHANGCVGKLVCTICNQEFQTKRLLERHRTKHKIKLMYRCCVCGRNYSRRNHYRTHREKCKNLSNDDDDSMFSDYDEDDAHGADPLTLVTNNLHSKKFDLYDYNDEKLCS